MRANPDAAMSSESAGPQPESRTAARPKPRLALFIATACGLGYLPVAPGTFGSIAGILLYAIVQLAFPPIFVPGLRKSFEIQAWSSAWAAVPIVAVIAVLGVWAADRCAKYMGAKDPQKVVIDEVSGQHLAYSLGLAALNWKYLVLGFILFRVFDIWKPFPVRQAESLPGGWGIMADDWIAGIYAAVGLWIARAAGL
jgi:phosphatidylglycerophosphatase A